MQGLVICFEPQCELLVPLRKPGIVLCCHCSSTPLVYMTAQHSGCIPNSSGQAHSLVGPARRNYRPNLKLIPFYPTEW